MLRFLIWLLIGFMFVKIVRLFLNRKQYADDEQVHAPEPPIPPFSDVQDADFEDITPKSPPTGPEKPPD